MNVSFGKLERYVLKKVRQGEYESFSEVIREALRLLKRRDELWQAKVRTKIKEGMASLRAGRTIPAAEVWADLRARRDATLKAQTKRRSRSPKAQPER